MAELSRDEVVGVLGRLSDVIIAEIIATGITKDELAAARERVVRDPESPQSGVPLRARTFRPSRRYPGAIAGARDLGRGWLHAGIARAAIPVESVTDVAVRVPVSARSDVPFSDSAAPMEYGVGPLHECAGRIFGGATRHVLAHARLPVLMAH